MMTTEKKARWIRVLVFAVLALVCLWRLGDMPLQETDEGFAANRAASFERHGTWRVAYDDVDEDVPQFRKPLLLYWSVAVLYRVVGYNEWAVRLPTALAGLAVCWLVFRINRRVFDEATALAAAVLFCVVPFVLWHIRTAMLELPVLALTLAAVYGLAFRPWGRAGALLAGAAAAGAILTKGGGGSLALLAAPLLALVFRSRDRRVWLDIAGFVLLAAGVLALYYLIVPPEFRERMLKELFIKEGARRFRAVDGAQTWKAFAEPMWALLWPLLVPALFGVAAVVRRAVREPDGRRWIAMVVLLTVPVAYGASHQLVPYARYFLPLFPWIATLAAVGLFTWLRQVYALPVLSLVAALAWYSPTARACHPHPIEQPYPGLREIALRVPGCLPVGRKVVYAAGRWKCQQLLFYGRRSVASEQAWLATDWRHFPESYAVVKQGEWVEIPLVRTEVVAQAGETQLLRLHVSADRPEVTAVILAKPRDVQKRADELRAKGKRVETFGRGVLILAADR